MSAIKKLSRMLDDAIKSLYIDKMKFGNIDALAEAEKEVNNCLQQAYVGNNKATDYIFLVDEFLREDIDILQINSQTFNFKPYNKITSCINDKGTKKKCIAENKQKLIELLNIYQYQIDNQGFRRLAYYGILSSYFSFNIKTENKNNQDNLENLEILRLFISKNFHIYNEDSNSLPWVTTLAQHLSLLSHNPCDTFAKDVLSGYTSKIDAIAKNIGIPANSWFWSKLVISAAEQSAKLKDNDFKSQLDNIIKLLEANSIFKDDVIIILLNRYYRCESHAVHENFKDYLIHKDIWGNPKLKQLKTSATNNWYKVDENIWKMVLKWVTYSNLKDFFELISSKYEADNERMEFWQQYLEQIAWSKLIFGKRTLEQVESKEEIKKLIQSEEGVSANLQSNIANLDAFILQIGDYYIVEFSITSNAAYVYRKEHVYFNLHAKELSDGTGKKELKAGFRDYPCEMKIQHQEGWQYRIKQKFIEIGIYPDNYIKNDEITYKSTKDNIDTKINRPKKLENIINWLQENNIEYSNKNNIGGKFWVYYSSNTNNVNSILKSYGFKYASHVQAWYWEQE